MTELLSTFLQPETGLRWEVSEDWSEYKTVFRTISSLATVKSSTSTAPLTAVASTTPANKERC